MIRAILVLTPFCFLNALAVAQSTDRLWMTLPPRGEGLVPVRADAFLPAYPEGYGWVLWWSANREDFLAPCGLREGVASKPEYASEARPLAADVVRKEVIPLLLAALKEKEPQVRANAAIALGRCGEARDVAALLEALSDRENSVAEAAILGLGLIADPTAVDALGKILANEDAPARKRGLAALGLGLSARAEAQSLLFDDLGRRKNKIVEACRVFGVALWAGADRNEGSSPRAQLAASVIQKALANEDLKDRALTSIGTAALAKLRDPGSAEFVRRALTVSNAAVRAGAAIAAGRVFRPDDPQSVKALVDAFRAEGNVLNQRLMLVSLGRVGGAQGRKVLAEELQSPERHHRSFSALGLGLAGATGLAPWLRAQISETTDERVKGAYMIALALMKDPAAFDLVMGLARERVTDELLTHYLWFFAVTRNPAATPIIRHMLDKCQEPEYQQIATIALGVIGGSESLSALESLLIGNGPATGKGAAAIGLGRTGDARALGPLLKSLAGKEQTVCRAAAIEGVGMLAQRKPVSAPPFARFAIDSYYAAVLNPLMDELSTKSGTGRLNAEERGNRGF